MPVNSINTKGSRFSKLAIAMLVSTSLLTLSGCFGVDSNNPAIEDTGNSPDTPTPAPTPAPTPTPTVGLAKLHTEGTEWVNADGDPVILKGTNLGNWLLQEFWMMNQSANTVATDQCRLEATLDERFGFDERERLLDLFRDNWIADRDWDVMQSFGLNVVRVPFIWNLIEDENAPMTLRADAWQYIDYAIESAEEHGMYVILDLHGAVGAQGLPDHSGCAGLNEYWSTPDYQERTIWLWQQIAERYKDNGTVAAYGLLNEPWGTDAANLADVMLTLHDAVRETDGEKIILLPGHHSGIDEYGHPDSFGGTNVAFEMHFYPGIFGWGEPNYETHRDWLTCGENGTSGVCEWNARMQGLESPLLIGEFQPWANLGAEFGAKNTRATYDKYAEFNWAATSWSYKVLTANGGVGQGTWGMVTNKTQDLGLITKSSTWVCPAWDSSFAEACETPADTVLPTAEGAQTYYLVIKFGACCDGALDASIDKVSLLDDTGAELVLNGDFGSQDDWTIWSASGAPTLDFNSTEAGALPTGSEGAVLRMTGAISADTVEINGGVYQAISLEGGKEYTFSGVFKDNGGVNSWAEIYLVAEEPVDGVDVVPEEGMPGVDFANAPIEDIEAIYQLYGTVEYAVHEPLLAAMTDNEPSTLYTLPNPPTGLAVSAEETGVALSWNANDETDLIGYNIYRSDGNNFDFQLIAEIVNDVVYVDTSATVENSAYFYKIAAVDNNDISYLSEEVVSGINVHVIPGLIEAESWTSQSGFQLEATTDTGGGSNAGFADAGDWLEYSVNISEAGSYLVEYRLATESGSEGFTVSVDGDLIDTVTVAATGGWQTWATQSNTVDLPAGEHTIRLDAVGGAWNINWIRFTASESSENNDPMNLISNGTFEDAAGWTVVSQNGDTVGDEMVSIAGGVVTFSETSSDPWQHAGIYTAVELSVGSYQFEMDISHGDDIANVWGELYIGSAEPVDGEEYNGDQRVLNVYNFWDCGSDAYSGAATAYGCDADNNGRFDISEAGTYYLHFRSGGETLGLTGAVLDNWSLIEINPEPAPEPAPEAVNVITNGTFEDATGWTVVSQNGDTVGDEMVNIADGVVTFSETSSDPWQHAGIYTVVELSVGTYQFEMDIAHGNDILNVWGELYIGSTEPVDGEEYSGDQRVLKAYHFWDCGSDAYSGSATASGCDGDNNGRFDISEAGTYYLHFRSGGETLGLTGAVLDNWSLQAVQ